MLKAHALSLGSKWLLLNTSCQLSIPRLGDWGLLVMQLCRWNFELSALLVAFVADGLHL